MTNPVNAATFCFDANHEFPCEMPCSHCAEECKPESAREVESCEDCGVELTDSNTSDTDALVVKHALDGYCLNCTFQRGADPMIGHKVLAVVNQREGCIEVYCTQCRFRTSTVSLKEAADVQVLHIKETEHG